MKTLSALIDPKVIDLLTKIDVDIKGYSEVDFTKHSVLKNFLWFPQTCGGMYCPETDEIFVNEALLPSLNLIALHEVIHWTGHRNRLKRECILNMAMQKPYTAEQMHTEELIAEMGAIELSKILGVQNIVYETFFSVDKARRYTAGNPKEAKIQAWEAVQYIAEIAEMKEAA